MSEGVAEGAVGEKEIIDAGLREGVAELWGGGGAGDGGGAGAGGGAELATEFESFEESAPGGIDGSGIGFPRFVKFFQEGPVSWVTDAAEGRGRGCGRAVGIEAV